MSRFKRIIAASFAGAASLGFLAMADQQQQAKPTVTPVKYKKRADHLREISANPVYDVVVVGGGCNGAGVALDAATRGLRTLVIEREDFGSGASSKSTKLIHGGVRYLQQVFDFSLDSISSRVEKFALVKEAIC
jgi:glycerol-3-phosphate dehydrogenase